MTEYPRWICSPCGLRFGKRVPDLAAFHSGKCGWCGALTGVTEPRDYGHPPAPNKGQGRTQ